MKLSPLAIIAAATLAVVNAATCDLTKITPLLTNSNVGTCASDSGYSFTALAAPTAQMLPKICASTACKNVVAAVKALNLGDCTLVGLRLQTDLLTPINNACGTGSGSHSGSMAGSTTGSHVGNSTAGNSTAGNGTTTMAPSTSTSPAPSSTKKNGSGSGSGTASPSSTSTPASASTPTPTPTPASGASSTALATGAVVVAIAAAIF
ncbi:Elicitin-like protein [Globisporangium polare]